MDARVQAALPAPASYSYPSGHSTWGAGLALVLSELAPDYRKDLLARGNLVGHDRVLLGIHFPSDIQGGRILAAYLVSRLDADPQFQSDLAKANMELSPYLAKQSVIAPGAKLEKLADGFKFTEGPTADADGNVFFTDQPNDRILKWSVDGKLSTFLQPAGRSNGMCFDKKGNLIACADEKNELWSIDPRQAHRPRQGLPGQAPQRPQRRLAPPRRRPLFHRPLLQARLLETTWPQGRANTSTTCPPTSKTLTRVTEDLKQPNGITGTPDGKTLYVADIGAGKTYAYDIQPDGSLANKRLFCPMGSDGMTLDSDGNVYLTGRGVTVFDRTGHKIEHIPVPDQQWTANVSFGGKDRQTLFITAGKGLYSIRLNFSGANPSK